MLTSTPPNKKTCDIMDDIKLNSVSADFLSVKSGVLFYKC